jgi:holo-[acyl-carrier protein] synthase
MNIIGLGIDIVEVQRIKELLGLPEEHFEMRCFTTIERNSAQSGANRIQFLAGRFAAKEAVLKALGTGWSHGTAWTDIEIQQLPSGKPLVVLYNKCKDIAEELGINSWLVSISHTDSYATASAIAVGHE